MIYTITLNPSLDYFVTVHHFELGKTNRTEEEQMLPGGKGLNVSMVLKNLGQENTALGFIAGFVGQEISRRIKEMHINEQLVMLDEGVSRINVKLKNVEGTEINGLGPDIPQEKLEKMFVQLDALKAGDILVLAGSIPSSLPDSIYRDIMARLAGKGVEIVVDATKELLRQVLPYKPFLIKPNNHELGELFGVTLKTRQEVIPYAKKLQEEGARNVLISMAGEGAVLAAEDGQVLEAPAPKGVLKNGVGAGDSMVAGFITGWMEEKDYTHAFRMGVCTGSASAFSDKLATRAEVSALLKQMR